MLHERGLLYPSDNRSRSPTVPHSVHSLRRAGGEGGSLPILACITCREVQYLAQQDKKSIYSEIADSHTKQQETKIKHQNHDRKTAHGTTDDFVFFAG